MGDEVPKMIEIAVVDSSAEARNQLADRIIRFQSEVQQKNPTCPQLSVRVLSLQELPFAEQPDVCVIGGECLSNDLVEIATVRTHMPDARLIADCPSDLANLVIIEQMGRLGVDDIINQHTSAEEFFRKLVLLSKRAKKSASGKLIAFDSGKGGVGVTSVVAATATTLFNKGLKVAVIDLDSETQDLTRFLSVRPVINENLAAMLSQERAVVKEFVEQALMPIWGHGNLVCVPPVLSSLQALPARSPTIRIFLSFLEQLDHLYDVILVDIAGIRGGLYNSILRVADSVIFVTNPEPASMFATTQVVKETLRLSPHPDAIRILQNSTAPGGMFAKLVNIELLRSLKLNKSQCMETFIPYVSAAAKWPGSGQTMDILCKSKLEKTFNQFIQELGILSLSEPNKIKTEDSSLGLGKIVSGLFSLIQRSTTPNKISDKQAPQDIKLPDISVGMQVKQIPNISLPVFESDLK